VDTPAAATLTQIRAAPQDALIGGGERRLIHPAQQIALVSGADWSADPSRWRAAGDSR
jgi:hypothetical protein